MLERLSRVLILVCVAACGEDGEGSVTAGTGGTAQSGGSGGGPGGGGHGGAGEGGAAGGGIGGGGSPACMPSGEWTLVDDFVAGPGDDTMPTALAIAPAGSVYAFGNHLGLSESLLRRSDDGGASWETTAAFTCGPPRYITVDGQGTVYVGCTSGTPFHALVLASSDGGATFTTADDHVVDSMSPCYAPALTTGGDGQLYSAGMCAGSGKYVRSSPDGLAWTTAHTTSLGSPSALLFVAATADGSAWHGSPGGAWSVVHGEPSSIVSVDGTFELAPGKPASVWAVSASGARVYAGGRATDGVDVEHTVLRRRDAAGAWSTLDDVTVAAGGAGTWPLTRPLEIGGALVYLVNGEGGAITRRSDDDGQSWQTIDTFALQGGQPTGAADLAADAQGNLYAAYAAEDAGGVTHWIVRKMSCR
jgi:hypothetical protein